MWRRRSSLSLIRFHYINVAEFIYPPFCWQASETFLTLSCSESNFPKRSCTSPLSNMCTSLIGGKCLAVALEATGWCISNISRCYGPNVWEFPFSASLPMSCATILLNSRRSNGYVFIPLRGVNFHFVTCNAFVCASWPFAHFCYVSVSAHFLKFTLIVSFIIKLQEFLCSG